MEGLALVGGGGWEEVETQVTYCRRMKEWKRAPTFPLFTMGNLNPQSHFYFITEADRKTSKNASKFMFHLLIQRTK